MSTIPPIYVGYHRELRPFIRGLIVGVLGVGFIWATVELFHPRSTQAVPKLDVVDVHNKIQEVKDKLTVLEKQRECPVGIAVVDGSAR